MPVATEVAQQKVLQYLTEAHASEQALTRGLESQITMTPRGAYRDGLERHLDETKDHAVRVAERLQELGQSSNPVLQVFGLAETVVGQVLALGKTPIDLVRGTDGAEKVLKNAKDACATEALEIATYTAIERVARDAGDDDTAELATSIRADEERMLERVLEEIPRLASAVTHGDFDVAETGAGEAVQGTAKAAGRTAKRAAGSTKRAARRARKVPGVAQAEGQVKGAVATEGDLAIARYDSLNAGEVTSRLADLSQIDLAKIDSYERKHQNRSTVLQRVESLRGDEPWAGYDELTVDEVKAVLSEGDDERIRDVRTYERAHKARAGIDDAADAALSDA